MAAVQPSAQATSFLTSAVPSSLASQGLQPEKCYERRVWKTFVPQTSSRDSGEKEGASLTRQEAASSPLRRTLGGGAGRRTKCGWDVWKASEDSASLTSAFRQLLIFLLGAGGGKTCKGHRVEACVNGKGGYLPHCDSVSWQNKKQGCVRRRNECQVLTFRLRVPKNVSSLLCRHSHDAIQMFSVTSARKFSLKHIILKYFH